MPPSPHELIARSKQESAVLLFVATSNGSSDRSLPPSLSPGLPRFEGVCGLRAPAAPLVQPTIEHYGERSSRGSSRPVRVEILLLPGRRQSLAPCDRRFRTPWVADSPDIGIAHSREYEKSLGNAGTASSTSHESAHPNRFDREKSLAPKIGASPAEALVSLAPGRNPRRRSAGRTPWEQVRPDLPETSTPSRVRGARLPRPRQSASPAALVLPPQRSPDADTRENGRWAPCREKSRPFWAIAELHLAVRRLNRFRRVRLKRDPWTCCSAEAAQHPAQGVLLRGLGSRHLPGNAGLSEGLGNLRLVLQPLLTPMYPVSLPSQAKTHLDRDHRTRRAERHQKAVRSHRSFSPQHHAPRALPLPRGL